MACIGIFFGCTALLFQFAYCAWPRYKKLASVFAAGATSLVIVGVDAFIIEPNWLEVRHETVYSNKIDKPLKMVVIADLQTDRVGNFEREALRRAMDEHPDLILFPGDYIETSAAECVAQRDKLRQCMSDVHLVAPLGIYATEGDHEAMVQVQGWPDIFKDLSNAHCFVASGTVSSGAVSVTGLSLKDSYRPECHIPHENNLHIIVGHRPDFARFVQEGDICVAGHTHGGQVQLPFFGPIMTFSEMPRKWCGGCNLTMSNGKQLIISRGVGMERGQAPRLRFLCRPEIVVVDVLPAR